MPHPPRLTAALRWTVCVVLTIQLAACATAPSGEPAAASPAPKGESEALMAAENALRAGDCRGASENYLAAARASTDSAAAMRASQLAVGCEQFTTARMATQRWLQLDPWSGDAALTSALVALKRYDLKEARTALTTWRDSGSAGSQDPLRFAELLEQETDATAVYRVFGDVLVNEDPTAEVLLAEARLAMAAHNMKVARSSAEQALTLDSELVEARIIILRAMSVQGQNDAAIEGARALQGVLEGEVFFEGRGGLIAQAEGAVKDRVDGGDALRARARQRGLSYGSSG